jgi:SAM-dependent methyltransferase/uncharacterized protein YbaR (Trm112 family)
MSCLQDSGIPLSPYLEIGAERGQRALVLENRFGARGAAADLSLEMLQTCEHYASAFGCAALPLRICCDVNNLPFLSGSLPFVFAYSVLHHFPDPAPIVAEIHRTLTPGGTLFFAEEPYRKTLYLPLYRRRDTGIPHRSQWARLADHFFRIKYQNEEKHGIESNQSITLRDWRRALSPFPVREVTLRAWLRDVQVPLFPPMSRMKYLWAYLAGGSLSGTCRKAGEVPDDAWRRSREQTLACPACREAGRDEPLARLPDDHSFLCLTCGRGFPVVSGVAILLSPRSLQELYPEFASK